MLGETFRSTSVKLWWLYFKEAVWFAACESRLCILSDSFQPFYDQQNCKQVGWREGGRERSVCRLGCRLSLPSRFVSLLQICMNEQKMKQNKTYKLQRRLKSPPLFRQTWGRLRNKYMRKAKPQLTDSAWEKMGVWRDINHVPSLSCCGCWVGCLFYMSKQL